MSKRRSVEQILCCFGGLIVKSVMSSFTNIPTYTCSFIIWIHHVSVLRSTQLHKPCSTQVKALSITTFDVDRNRTQHFVDTYGTKVPHIVHDHTTPIEPPWRA